MAKQLLTFILLCIGALVITTHAETALLNENFEKPDFPPVDWSVIQDQTPGVNAEYGHWHRTTQSPIANKAEVYIKTSYDEPEKTEWLITPEMQLPAEEYRLEFKMKAQKSGIDDGYFNFIVKISTDNGQTWSDIWDGTKEESVRASGMPWPWKAWEVYTPIINLSPWKNQKIKIAFWYHSIRKNDYTTGSISIDDVIVDKYTDEFKPEISGSTSYKFVDVYVGVRKNSTPLTIKNTGREVLKITGLTGLENTDFSTSIDPEKVALTQGEEYSYYVYYDPTETGKRSAVLQIQSNGGTLNVNLEGTKIMLEEGYTLESFESGALPPTGWTHSNWSISQTAHSGFYSATNTILSQCYLTSPRLDLSSGNTKVIFDFLEYFNDETGTLDPENYFTLEIKVDDEAWVELWQAYDPDYNQWIRKELDLSSYTSNNCYLRWSYTGDFSAGFETVASDIILDDIVLPPLYGADQRPLAAINPSPASEASDCPYTHLTLSWEGAIHAEGYKLYVGTNATDPVSFVNGEIVNGTAYELQNLVPATTYYWKVVPFNAAGECISVITWNFTTMSDQTIGTFPYLMDFNGNVFPPLGWELSGTGRPWNRNSYNPLHGEGSSASVFLNVDNTESILQTPLVVLPADIDPEEAFVSFWWAKNMPVSLTEAVTTSASEENPVENDILYFEIKTTDSENWTTVASTLEENYWEYYRAPLTEYLGKQLYMRWRYTAKDAYNGKAGALDDVYIGKPVSGITDTRFDHPVRIRPVPTKDILYLDGIEKAEVRIYDVTGKLLISETTERTLNVSTLQPGLYTLEIHTQEIIRTFRFIKN